MAINKKIPHITSSDKVILFDEECMLCNGWCKFIIKYDKEYLFKLTSMQSKKGQEILHFLNKNSEHFDTMLLINNNEVYEKSTAVLEIVKNLPFPIKSLSTFRFIPTFFRDRLYNLIALNRYKLFGKKNECVLVEKESERFL